MKIIVVSIFTILCMRIFATFAMHSNSLRYMYFDNSYHLYYGLGMIILIKLFKKYIPFTLRYLAFGIGTGLIIDDLGVIKYILFGNPVDPIGAYWSALFILPMLIGLLLVVLFEDKIRKFI